ncbi:MAG TPA: RNA-binding protein [Clostridiaceae bacterium]|nr:RNA-binding protein [Clostridiaceae bacterium]
MEVELGRIVISKAGRDAGKLFVITGIIDEASVYVADGNLRRIEKPKKKNIKHLEFTRGLSRELNKKLINKEKVTNAEIRKYLGEFEIDAIIDTGS